MISVEASSQIYISQRGGNPMVLVKGIGGVPEICQPRFPILRTTYVSPGIASSAGGLERESSRLQDERATLLAFLESSDGPPSRSALVFYFMGEETITWNDGRRHRRGLPAKLYGATISLSTYSWATDLRAGKHGYFLSGVSGALDLWRIERFELDAAGRQIFTLRPVRLATGLPPVDFSGIPDQSVRTKLEQHWREIQHCVHSNLHQSLITAIKNVAETLVVYYYPPQSVSKGMTFAAGLQKVLNDVNAGKKSGGPKPCFEELDYPLMSKMRLLHQRTHADRTLSARDEVSPELALSTTADLVEVLLSLGMTKGS